MTDIKSISKKSLRLTELKFGLLKMKEIISVLVQTAFSVGKNNSHGVC